MADAVFRPKSYLPPVPEGPAGYEGPPRLAPSDVEAHLTRLSREHPEIYSRVFRGLLQVGSQNTYSRNPFDPQGVQGVQGYQGWQGPQGSPGLPGRLGSEGHEGIPSEFWGRFEIGEIYTIPELEIIGHLIGAPYLSMYRSEDDGGKKGFLRFKRRGKSPGLVWLDTVSDEYVIQTNVSFLCEYCHNPIVRWVALGTIYGQCGFRDSGERYHQCRADNALLRVDSIIS